MTIPSSTYSYTPNQYIELKGKPLEIHKIFRPEDFIYMQCTGPVLKSRVLTSLNYYQNLKDRTASQVDVDLNSLREWTEIVLKLESLKAEIASSKID